MKHITSITDILEHYKISASDKLDIMKACNDYIEAEKRQIKVSATKGFAKMVEDMRDIQRSKGNASKQEQAVDRAITQINKYK